jgi:hypothetical protein
MEDGSRLRVQMMHLRSMFYVLFLQYQPTPRALSIYLVLSFGAGCSLCKTAFSSILPIGEWQEACGRLIEILFFTSLGLQRKH